MFVACVQSECAVCAYSVRAAHVQAFDCNALHTLIHTAGAAHALRRSNAVSIYFPFAANERSNFFALWCEI